MGLLQQPVDRTNYTVTRSILFSHNSQQYDVQRLDLRGILGETGVSGRLLDELARKGFKTSSNSVGGHAHAAAGDPLARNPSRQVSAGNVIRFNQDPTISTINTVVEQLNGVSNVTNNRFAETWSSNLMQSLRELSEANSISQNPAFTVTDFKSPPSPLDRQFQAAARYIKARTVRNVDREVFVIEDGGYDMHQNNGIAAKLAYIDSTLRAFKAEMVKQGLWKNVVIVTGSDFGRVSVFL